MKNAMLTLALAALLAGCAKDENGLKKPYENFNVNYIEYFIYTQGLDLTSDPDVFIVIKQGTTIIATSDIVPDEVSYIFNLAANPLPLKYNTTYSIEFWDQDLTGNEYITTLPLILNNNDPEQHAQNSAARIKFTGMWK